jgi:peptide/nickel transport system permease protein
MADLAPEREPRRDVGARYGTAATESAAERAVGARPVEPSVAEREVGARSQLSLAARRFVHHRMALLGLAIFLVLVLGAFIVPYFWRWSYSAITPAYASGPSAAHPFGTDTIGHDLFAQVLAATQTSLKTAFIVTVIATSVGTIVGAVAGYYGGLADAALMRFTDLVLTVPLIALLLVLSNTLSTGNYFGVALVVAAVLWTYLARLVRGTFLSLREHDYVIAARAIGSRDARIIFRHMIPNAFGPIVVNATLTVANAILIESALSFLGLGIQPPEVSLGSLINSGQGAATTLWWLFAFPSAVLVIIILAVNFVGDGLRDALDPRQRRVRA